MVKKIYYFCTASHTEFGGIDAFLLKINRGIQWVRQFPITIRKAPKPVRSDQRQMTLAKFSEEDEGLTGKNLKARMIQIIKDYPANFSQGNCDGILLIDDADCRFSKYEEFLQWRNELSDELGAILGYRIPLYILLASPEIEAWFLMDWKNSFAEEYPNPPGFEHQLKQCLIDRIIGKEYWDAIEHFGGPRKDGSCTKKLSNGLIYCFEDPELIAPFLEKHRSFFTENRLYYSKKRNGAMMLNRILPEVIAANCRVFFAPTYRELVQI